MSEQTANITALIDSDLAVTAITLAQERNRPPDWQLEQREARPQHGLVFVLEGGALYQIGGENLTVRQNEILYLPRGSRYLTRANARDPYHFLVVSFQLAADDVLAQLPMPNQMRPANPGAYQHLFRELVQRWQHKEILYKLKCQALLADILHQLIQEIVAKRVDPALLDRLQPAVSLMDQQYTQALSIDDLAHQCHLSTAHFRRLFRKAYGLSPQQYIQNLRIGKAKDLIRSELYSMSEVAARSGFGNIYYFSRVFRQATGMPPSTYGRQV